MKHRIDYGNEVDIYKTAVAIMSESKDVYGSNCAFSVILDKEHKLPEDQRTFIEGECPDWITFCGEMRIRGYSRVIDEIEWLESKIHAVVLERNVMDCFNNGDKEGLDLCLKAMTGVISKAKLGLGKGDADRKNAEFLMKIKGDNRDKLEKYDTDKLEAMLEAVKKKEAGDGDK